MSEETDERPFWDIERYRRGSPTAGRDDRPPKPPGGDGGGGPWRRGGSVPLRFAGRGPILFWIMFKGFLLSALTLGIYRFWMITRVRRFYAGAAVVDGDPLEYTGRPLEKLLGFLLALVLLAVYLGLVNLALTFVGLSFAAEEPALIQLTIQLSIVATLPLIFYASYQAMRYRLSRTRWRGIRFGLGPGAWGYTARGVGYSLLTAVTLGVLYPYQHFHMAKYMTDRSWFGDRRFEQHGSWLDLLAQWLWIYVAAVLGAIMIWGAAANPGDQAAGLMGGFAASFGGLVILLLIQRYRIVAFRILWSNRICGPARFSNVVRVRDILMVYVTGTIATGAIAIAIGLPLGAAVGIVSSGVVDQEALRKAAEAGDMAALQAAWPVFLVGLGYIVVMISLVSALSEALVSMRSLAYKVDAMRVEGIGALADSRQREAEAAGEAGGFADALGVDIGAGV